MFSYSDANYIGKESSSFINKDGELVQNIRYKFLTSDEDGNTSEVSFPAPKNEDGTFKPFPVLPMFAPVRLTFDLREVQRGVSRSGSNGDYVTTERRLYAQFIECEKVGK